MRDSNQNNQLLPLSELSNLTGISRRTLLRHINNRSNSLPAFRLSRRGKLLVNLREFRTWLKKFRVRREIKFASVGGR
jgi:transcriptional antiterminator